MNESPVAQKGKDSGLKSILRAEFSLFSDKLAFFCGFSSRHSGFWYHLTCRPSGGNDCCSSVFPSRSSSSRAEFPGVEPEEWGWEGGSGLRRRLGAAGRSGSVLSEDWKEKSCVWTWTFRFHSNGFPASNLEGVPRCGVLRLGGGVGGVRSVT